MHVLRAHAVYSRHVDNTVPISGCILEHVSTEMADASEGFVSEFSSADEGSDRESEGTDHDSDSTRAPDPKWKHGGLALYNTKYDHAWRVPVYRQLEMTHTPSFNKVVSCNHMGISDIKRHVQGLYHQKLSKQLDSNWSSHLFQAAVQQRKWCVDACITMCVCGWCIYVSISPGSTCWSEDCHIGIAQCSSCFGRPFEPTYTGCIWWWSC